MKKFLLFFACLLILPAYAEEQDYGFTIPEWKDFAPSAYVDVEEPKGLGKLNEIAVKMLNFLDKLTEKERDQIKAGAKAVSKKKKVLREIGIKEQMFKELDLKTPLELLSSHSKHELNLFKNINECEEASKETLLETVQMGFEIQSDAIDNLENIILNGANK